LTGAEVTEMREKDMRSPREKHLGKTGKFSYLVALRGTIDSLQKGGPTKERLRRCSGRAADGLIRHLIKGKADLHDVVP
jgi:hypothetical protein